MNFRNIEYFIAIVDAGNMSKAAERLHISQQSLSEMLKKLEDEVDTKLIKRGRSVELTPAGEIFLHKSREIFSIYSEMMDEIVDISEKESTTITLAIPETETPIFLPELLTEFLLLHPEINVNIIQCEPKEAVKQAGSFDLYFNTLPLGDELESVLLVEDTYAVSFTYGLAKNIYGNHWPDVEAMLLQNRDIYTLRSMPFILLGNRLGEIVLDQQLIFQEAGFAANIAFQSNSSELNSIMCAMGRGVYVTTMGYCRRRFSENIGKNNEILLYPIDTSISPVGVALSYRKGKHLTKADKCFIRAAKNFLQNH